MITPQAVITNAGASALLSASASNPLPITKVVVGQAVASPVAGQIVPATPAATSLAQVKYTADTGLLVSRNLTGSCAAIRLKIPASSYGYFVLQFGVYSGNTLLGISAIPAVARDAQTGDMYYTVLLPVDNLVKIVTNTTSLKLASKATFQAGQDTVNGKLASSFPIGQEGSTIVTDGNSAKQAIRLVTFAAITETAGELQTEKNRAATPRPKLISLAGGARTCIDLSSNVVWSQNADTSWSGSAALTDAQLVTAFGVGRFFHNPVTGRTYYTGPDKIRRIF